MTEIANQPIVLPRSEHCISRKQIDPDTLKVLYRLARNGHKAFLVGGCVRDLLLEREPKDFDVATDATPEQVKRLFRNCFVVGRRFRLALLRFGKDKTIEVATFRRHPSADELPEDPADHFGFVENVFGTPATDAFRRDTTINALFYDIENFSILDYTDGLEDLKRRRLRVIGDPMVRFTEDPVRMLRCLEFCARLSFSLDEKAREAIYIQAPLIAEAAPPRIREEVMELFRHCVAGEVLRSAQGMGLLEPLLAGYEGDEETFALLDQLDERTRSGVPINESTVLAALFLSRFRRLCDPSQEIAIPQVIHLANQVLDLHCGYFHIAHGIRHSARELLIGFFRMLRGRGRRGEKRFLRHPGTPAVIEFFSLWTQVSGEGQELARQWKEAVKEPEGGRPQATPQEEQKSKRPRRRRRRRRPAAAASDQPKD